MLYKCQYTVNYHQPKCEEVKVQYYKFLTASKSSQPKAEARIQYMLGCRYIIGNIHRTIQLAQQLQSYHTKIFTYGIKGKVITAV